MYRLKSTDQLDFQSSIFIDCSGPAKDDGIQYENFILSTESDLTVYELKID